MRARVLFEIMSIVVYVSPNVFHRRPLGHRMKEYSHRCPSTAFRSPVAITQAQKIYHRFKSPSRFPESLYLFACPSVYLCCFLRISPCRCDSILVYLTFSLSVAFASCGGTTVQRDSTMDIYSFFSEMGKAETQYGHWVLAAVGAGGDKTNLTWDEYLEVKTAFVGRWWWWWWCVCSTGGAEQRDECRSTPPLEVFEGVSQPNKSKE